METLGWVIVSLGLVLLTILYIRYSVIFKKEDYIYLQNLELGDIVESRKNKILYTIVNIEIIELRNLEYTLENNLTKQIKIYDNHELHYKFKKPEFI